MSRHRVKFDGGKFSVLCDGVIVLELPLHQETEQLREQLDAASALAREEQRESIARAMEWSAHANTIRATPLDATPLADEARGLRLDLAKAWTELAAARDAERAATEDLARLRETLQQITRAARRLRERIAKTMGSEPDDDDDLVECVRIAVEQLDAANADRAILKGALQGLTMWLSRWRHAMIIRAIGAEQAWNELERLHNDGATLASTDAALSTDYRAPAARDVIENAEAANARVKELEEALADAQRVPLLSPELESANRHLQAANADRARLREALREARAKVKRIYDHYRITEIARAVESKNDSQLCNYGEALAIMDAALAKVTP